MSLELEATVAAVGSGTVTDHGRRASAAPPALGPGTTLAHFRIEGLLGKGGMGEVYRATDLALDRPVALKVLPASVAADAGRRDRLFREARAQARLQHPNVCHIYYVGSEAGVVFFAMELVAGESLAERVARGPLPAEEAVELVRQAALGLREAHRHGFTHRDVKPSNLMLDHEGRVKVVDFGLVSREQIDLRTADAVLRAAAEPRLANAAVETGADLTGVVGTPLYMAPEQGQADAAPGPRADIYALGVTLHHLLSGRPPFEGGSLDELQTQHRESPRPRLAIKGKRGRALSAVDAVIAKMMAKRPEDRHASYEELIAELERVSVTHTRPAGAVVRALAMLIDVMLLAALQVPVQLALEADDRTIDGNVVVVAFGFVYYVLALSRFGTTIGRALLDLEVISVTGQGRPSLGQAAVRYAIEVGAFAAALAVSQLRQATGVGELRIAEAVLVIGGALWGFGDLIRAAVRTPDKRTGWDRVAGTMVRYRRR